MKILKNWKLILAVVLVFGAGVGTGSVMTFLKFKYAFERGFTIENWNSMTMRSLKKELQLTAEQEPKVRAIVEETGQQFGQAFGQAIRVSGTNLVISMHRIDKVLTPAQRAIHQRKFEEFREKLKKTVKVDLPPDPGQNEQP